MKNETLACYFLAASAFVLAALLFTQLPEKENRLPEVLSQAQAGLVATASDMIVLTAQADAGEDALYILDSRAEHLLIYTLDSRQQLRLAHGPIDIARLFETGSRGASRGGR